MQRGWNSNDASRTIEALIDEGWAALGPAWQRLYGIEKANQRRVIEAFQKCGARSYHLQGGTGYGYDDPAREITEAIFAEVFQGEAAIVRPQLASGTHALWVCLDALLKPGDHLVSVSGPPYDTLRNAIVGPSPHSLRSKGVGYAEAPLTPDGRLDFEAVERVVTPRTRVLFLQRSKGYMWRPGLGVADVRALVAWRDRHAPHAIVMVDNCYGEFVEESEPCAAGADLVAGSLIKNPGGTLAPAGGYIVGRRELIDLIAERVTAPGLGLHVGPTLGTARHVLQGLFLAPHLVAEALAGMLLASFAIESLGYEVTPRHFEAPADSVLAVRLGDPDLLVEFCRAVQAASPVDSDARPEPGPLPGYEHKVVMAAGTFIQGASSEFTADGPLRPPFAAFLQGGISRVQIALALPRILGLLAARKSLR